ncbi:MAG TPA: RNA pseudouridine synthase [Deltaproteobacteria bacterium]|nr:RNA pseudouridine synthase [Deltaproteobacteria bacterium]
MTDDLVIPEIIYQDNHLIAASKPPGMLTQPSGSSRESMEDLLKQWVKQTQNKPGNVYLHALHRLDRAASGIVLFAATHKALSRMNEEMRSKRITRIYHALVTGSLPAWEGILEHSLRHSRMKALVSSGDDPRSRESVLTYRFLQDFGAVTLVEITLITGRYHQIRAQLSACGCPIVGDTRYGSPLRRTTPGIALHHRTMAFTHPTLKTRISIEAAYPVDWFLDNTGSPPQNAV